MAPNCRCRTNPADYAIGSGTATGMIDLFGIGVGLGLNKPMTADFHARSAH